MSKVTAQHRAAGVIELAVANHAFGCSDDPALDLDYLRQSIAGAIEAAREDAIEECARLAERADRYNHIPDMIRALKSRDAERGKRG